MCVFVMSLRHDGFYNLILGVITYRTFFFFIASTFRDTLQVHLFFLTSTTVYYKYISHRVAQCSKVLHVTSVGQPCSISEDYI